MTLGMMIGGKKVNSQLVKRQNNIKSDKIDIQHKKRYKMYRFLHILTNFYIYFIIK